MSIDVSVVVLAHREGRLLHPALRSVYLSIDHAVSHGVTAEVLVLVDRPDKDTDACLQRVERPDVSIHRVQFGDPGLSRNHGRELATGSFVCFVDADHLCSRNWILEASSHLSSAADDLVVHPEYQISFGAVSSIWRQLSSSDPAINLTDQIEAPHWSKVAAARKSLFRRFPFSASSPETGFAFPEWHFDCETLAAGIRHTIIPGTVVFLRQRRSAAPLALDESLPVLRPSRLFDPETFASMLPRER